LAGSECSRWADDSDSVFLQADSSSVFRQADSGSVEPPADLGLADLALVDLDPRDSHLAGSDCSCWADDSDSVFLQADLRSAAPQVDSHWAAPEVDLHSEPADSRGQEAVLVSRPPQFSR